ncbi:hypothetical protein LCGC14_2876020, partial [marine sediment metagenome]
MSTPKKYKCPYCDRTAMSPGGVRFHIGSDHTDKVEEFKKITTQLWKKSLKNRYLMKILEKSPGIISVGSIFL